MSAFIRPYRPDDFDATALICRETLPPSLASSPDAVRLAPYIWTHQYTHLSPLTCFVLDDGSGSAVGYCIGCPDMAAFADAYPSYIANVLDPSPEITRPADTTTLREPWTLTDGSVNPGALAQQAYNPRWLLLDAAEAVAAKGYRATLHIDLLPAWQGRGWGRGLLERVVESLAAAAGNGGGGVWVGVAGDNVRVVPFYEKMAFRVWEGESIWDGVVTMVRDFRGRCESAGG
ncbi:hypothetical protein G7046_g8853 [Stylonectria norvegica]|nr:hypothetical protein G7046_g8853 [Stylonectria norvegica]